MNIVKKFFNLGGSKSDSDKNDNANNIIKSIDSIEDTDYIKMRYISDLLYKNDCVVIPGFGGFITEYTPARVNRLTNSMMPPCKKIIFNEKLQENDGLLAHYISTSNGITYKEAVDQITKFTTYCHDLLKQKKKVRFPEIGVLWNNDEGKLFFEPEPTENYLESSFGLSNVSSPKLIESSNEEKFRQEYINANNKKRKPWKAFLSFLKWAAIIIVLLVLGLGIILNLDSIKATYHKYSQYLIINNDNGDIVEDVSDEELEDQIRKYNRKVTELENLNKGDVGVFKPNDFGLNDNDEYFNDDNEIDYSMDMQEKPLYQDTPEPKKKVSQHKYHVIVGTYRTRSGAQKAVEDLNRVGYLATIAGKNAKGYYRISAISSNNKDEANRMLNIIRDEEYPSAWLLKE